MRSSASGLRRAGERQSDARVKCDKNWRITRFRTLRQSGLIDIIDRHGTPTRAPAALLRGQFISVAAHNARVVPHPVAGKMT